MIRTLYIAPELIVQEPTTEGHKNYGLDCFLAHSDELEEVLLEKYARPRLCLKVFKPLGPRQIKDPGAFKWGGALLTDCTKVQNILAMYRLSPWVYDVVLLNDERLAQVCDYADGGGQPEIKQAQKIVKKYRLGCAGYKDKGAAALRYVAMEFKWVGNKFVDLGRFYATDPKWYGGKLRRAIQHRPRGPRGEVVGYQSLPALDIPGQRRATHRLRHMRLGDYNFTGKTVLDLGCNLGRFCREAIDRGAKRVVGVDAYRTGLWQQANNWLGYWNIDFLCLNLPDQAQAIQDLTGIEKFDAVFALAIVQHIKGGYGKWIGDLTKEVLWLEGGFQHAPGFKREDLERDFPRVEMLGKIRDEDERDLYRCWRTPRPSPRMVSLLPKERREDAIRRGRTVGGRVMLYPETLGFLYDMARKAPSGRAIEIGAMDGSATVCWAAAREGRGSMEAIEIEQRPELKGNIEHYGYKVNIVIKDSKDAAPEIQDCAFLFIDGDHSREGVASDIRNYMPCMKPGGIVVFHDYGEGKHEGVRLAVDAWRKRAKWPVIGTCRSAIALQRPE